MKLAIAGGGTSGHVNPGLALAARANELKLIDEVQFYGTRYGLEARLVNDAGYSIELLPAGRVRGMGALTKVAGFAGLAAAVPMAMNHLRRFGADVVVGTGGYASAAPIAAAKLLGIPAVLLEQNTIPGSTNRGLASTVKLICTSFVMTSAYFPSWKVAVTGNPVRADIRKAREQRRKPEEMVFRVLVLGGSQGALFLNQTVAHVLRRMLERHLQIEVVHQTGGNGRDEAINAYGNQDRVEIVEYIEDMGNRLGDCDLVVGRAGATTIAELTVAGVPALLIPFPYATDNHQEHNAREMVRVGAAELFIQAEFQQERLENEIERLFRERSRLQRMAQAAARIGRPNAADDILERIGGLVCSD